MISRNTIVQNALAAKNASINDELNLIEKNTTKESNDFSRGTEIASAALRNMGQKMRDMVEDGVVSKKAMDAYIRQCEHYDKVYAAITSGRKWR